MEKCIHILYILFNIFIYIYIFNKFINIYE